MTTPKTTLDALNFTMPSTKTIFVSALGAIVLLALATTGPLMSQVEETTYTVDHSEGPIEIRTYPPTIVAETTTTGDRKTAIREGFQIIAGYIFGGNVGSRKIEMTAPVLQQRSIGSTSSHTAEQVSDRAWNVRFVMPKTWTLATLPKPQDQHINLRLLPSAKFAAIRFSGLARDPSIKEQTERLADFIRAQKLRPVGSPLLAFFNPPWTLPFLRRNEVMIEVQ